MAGPGHLTLYDLAGQRVRILVDGHFDAGAQVASGAFFYRLETAQTTLTRPGPY